MVVSFGMPSIGHSAVPTVERVIASIPADFLREVKNLSFQVEDWADAETLAESDANLLDKLRLKEGGRITNAPQPCCLPQTPSVLSRVRL